MVVFLTLLLLPGCSSKKPRVDKLASMPAEKICRVAVLPFINDSDYKGGERLFYRVFVAELVRAGKFLVSQEGDVREIYRQMHMFPNQPLDLEKVRILANRLDVQLVIAGSVIEMSDGKGSGSSLPKITVSMRILNDYGEFIWSTYHRRTGDDSRKFMHFGVINTTTELARRVVEDIVEAWLEEGFKRCID